MDNEVFLDLVKALQVMDEELRKSMKPSLIPIKKEVEQVLGKRKTKLPSPSVFKAISDIYPERGTPQELRER